ncbi:hypothetical protein WA158_008481, partial [Blastocystis sp. Blastoise]
MKFVLVFFVALVFAARLRYDFPFQDPSLSFEDRVDDLVGRLTIQEMIDQMAYGGNGNLPTGAIERLGIKPFVFSAECIAGDIGPATGNTTAFPIALATSYSFNRTLVHQIAEYTADEVRGKHNDYVKEGVYKVHAGITCWTPVVNIFRHPLWGRGQETYGECPVVNGILGAEMVKGLQGDNDRYFKAIATIKHYDVHCGPENIPVDRGSFNALVTEREWRTNYVPAFEYGVKAGAYSAMCSYNAINGIPACANRHLLQDILRDEMGFDGYVISDQEAIENEYSKHHYAYDWESAAALSVLAGCDLEDTSFMDNAYTKLPESLRRGLLNPSDIIQATKRLFMARMKLGEFDPEDMCEYKKLNSDEAEKPEHLKLATEGAEQSIALLMNKNNIVPLDRNSIKKIGVVGNHGMNGWAAAFGDYHANPSYDIQPVTGLKRLLGEDRVVYESACKGVACDEYDAEATKKVADQVDIMVVIAGLDRSIEAEGRDRKDIQLPGHQMDMIKDAVASGKKVIAFFYNAGALDLHEVEGIVDAIYTSPYAGMHVGTAFAEVLFGDYCPSGKLSTTWPMSLDQLLPIVNYTMHGMTYRFWDNNKQGEPLYPFGYGLSYTSFEYSNLRYEPSVATCETQKITIDVKNTGKYESDEVIFVFLTWNDVKYDDWPLKQLGNFDRIHLYPGETKTVTIELSPRSMAVLGNDDKTYVTLPGSISFTVGGQQEGYTKKNPSNILKGEFNIKGESF